MEKMNFRSGAKLLEKLKSEHCPGCYYRGQAKLYGQQPLWPSGYRHSYPLGPFPITGADGVKRMFSFWPAYFNIDGNETEAAAKMEESKLRNKKRVHMGYVRNALGYCLSEALFQQAGWESEGLDVTSNPDVAFYFATHEFVRNKYQRVPSNGKVEHVIYRWKFKEENWDFDRLNRTNFYNRPTLFPTKKVFSLFDAASSREDFLRSLEMYRRKIGWNGGAISGFMWENIEGQRPFTEIQIPKEWLRSSRIVNQDAALLFPHVIREFDQSLIEYAISCFKVEQRDKVAVVLNDSGKFVEDFTYSNACEVFTFRDDGGGVQALENKLDLYVENDITHELVTGWMRSFFRNEFGAIVIPIPDDTVLSKLEMRLSFEDRFSDGDDFNR